MTELEVVAKQIDEKVEQLKEAVLVGNLDYTGYQKICGENSADSIEMAIRTLGFNNNVVRLCSPSK